jgi:hypothetical protein
MKIDSLNIIVINVLNNILVLQELAMKIQMKNWEKMLSLLKRENTDVEYVTTY